VTDKPSAYEAIVELGACIYNRRLTPGRTGNLSVRVGDTILITPTGQCLGRLKPTGISEVTLEGLHLSGDPPSKEMSLHLALYRNHPEQLAVAHVHSPRAVAFSTLKDLPTLDPLPPITPYFVMRVGHLRMVEYFPPGSSSLLQAVEHQAQQCRCLLMRNHGSLVAGESLEAAIDAVEEIEQTAEIWFLLKGANNEPDSTPRQGDYLDSSSRTTQIFTGRSLEA
jgi:ribulose-5-phosphate 4-epimerase/fuculose-1-phosphate aldolase